MADLLGDILGDIGSGLGNILSNPIADLGILGSIIAPVAAPELLGLTLGGEAAGGGLAASALGGAELGGAAAGGGLGLDTAAATGAGVDLSSILANPGGGGGTLTGGVGDVAVPSGATFTSSPTPLASTGGPTATPGGGGGSLVDQLTQATAAGGQAGGEVPGADAGGSIFDKLISSAGAQAAKNPIGLGAGAAGLGLSLLKGNKQSPQEQQMAWQGAVLGQEGNQLQSYQMTGTLPPAMQAQLDQQIQAARARIIQNHAAQGRPTDPSQNSALAQELNNVDIQSMMMRQQLEESLFKQGLADLSLSNDLLKTVATFDRQDQDAITQALMNFSKAMSPGVGTIKLNA